MTANDAVHPRGLATQVDVIGPGARTPRPARCRIPDTDQRWSGTFDLRRHGFQRGGSLSQRRSAGYPQARRFHRERQRVYPRCARPSPKSGRCPPDRFWPDIQPQSTGESGCAVDSNVDCLARVVCHGLSLLEIPVSINAPANPLSPLSNGALPCDTAGGSQMGLRRSAFHRRIAKVVAVAVPVRAQSPAAHKYRGTQTRDR